MPYCVDSYWYFVPYRYRQKSRRIDLEVGESGGYNACNAVLAIMDFLLESDVCVVRGLSGERDFQIGIEAWLRRPISRHAESNCDHGELGPANNLDHVEVPVCVPGVKRLYRSSHQELACLRAAKTFASGCVRRAIYLVHRVGHVVRERGVVQHPLTLGSLGDTGHTEGERKKVDGLHGFSRHLTYCLWWNS